VATGISKVGFGYRVALPVAKYYTWHGTDMEGRGVEPDRPIRVDVDSMIRGQDEQMSLAVSCVR
jgi:C-terminal processing protease CtpA/Prc